MASFQSILKVGGKEYDILYSDLGLGQAVDSLGRPASAVYGGMITIELHTPANDATLYEWMVNPEKRMDGQVILRRLDSRATLKSIKFYNAYCVDMVIRFDGTANASSFKTTIRISPEQVEIGGLLHDNLWPDETPMGHIPDETAPKEEETAKKKEEPGLLSDLTHGVLDVVGLVPGFGEIADGVNALFYLAEGNKVDAALSAAAMVPFAGWAATGTKLFRKAAKLVSKIPVPRWLSKKMDDAAALIKKVCEKDPVDVATGMMLTQRVDFELPGPIPFVWERVWYSASDYRGPLGYGWHHRYDMGLTVEVETNISVLRLSEGRQVAFASPTVVGQPVLDRASGLTLCQPASDDPTGMPWRVWDQTQQVWYLFAPPSINGSYQPLYAVANRVGQYIEFRYGERGRLEQITDSAGRLLTLSYNEYNLVNGIYGPHPDQADARIQLVGYDYNEVGDLTAYTDAEGNRSEHRYEQHLLVQTTSPSGLNFYWEYEGNGADARCVHTWGDGDIHEGWFEYADERTTLMHDSDGTTRYTHQGGLVTGKINALGGEWHYEYNEYDELIAETDPLGAVTRYSHDEVGSLVSITYPDGTGQETIYDEMDRVVATVDALGSTWRYEYNDQGLLAQQTDPLDATTQYTYDEQGRLVTVVNALKQTTQLRYNDQHQLAHVVTPDEQIRSQRYDALGRLVEIISPTGSVQQRRYDRLGQLIEVVEPDGSRQELVYDGDGNVVEARQGEQTVSLTYTGAGRLAERRQGEQRVQFSYDREGRLVGLTNEADEEYRFELNALGEVITETGFDGLTRRYERDAAGRVIKLLRPADISTEYRYDAGGQVTEVIYSDGSRQNYVYDRVGNLVEARTADSLIELERDAVGQVVAERQNGYLVSSDYNLLGQRTGLTSSLGAAINLTLDSAANVTQIQAGSWQANFGYDQRGLQVQRQLSGDVTSQWDYDALGRPIRQHITSRVGGQRRQRSYQWAGIDALGSIDDSTTGLSQYQYDPVGVLTGTVYSDGSRDVRQTDPVGGLYRNVDRQDRQYGPGGQLRQSGDGTRYRYDAEGNLIRKTLADGDQWHYAWDAAGQLTSVKRPDGYTVSFTYDAFGRRLSKHFRGKTTRWVWDGNKPLHEWAELAVGSGADGVEDVITWLFEDDTFAPIGKLTSAGNYSVVTDHLGTPIEMYDEQGLKRWETQLDNYGLVRRGIGKVGDCPFRFQGQYEDAETGLYYNRFRYYDPQSGTYISQDPIGLAGGGALYGYVADTLTQVDIFGLSEGSTTLGNRLERAGMTHRIPGFDRGDFRAHHVIPHDVWTSNQSFFDDIGLGRQGPSSRHPRGFNPKDAAANGVFMPKNATVGAAHNFELFHSGGHPNTNRDMRRAVTDVSDRLSARTITRTQARKEISALQKAERIRLSSRRGGPCAIMP